MRPLSPAASQWYYTPDVLCNTPSAADGMPLETELKKRKLAVGYMISLGLRAGLDRHGQYAMRAVIMTASTFLHRFYMRRSMNDIKPEKAAAAILFLASKTEEAPLKLRHVANAASGKFDIQRAQEQNPESVTEGFKAEMHAKWEKIILLVEEQVLEAICFDLVVEQPWSGVVKGLRSLLGVGAGAGVAWKRMDQPEAGPSTAAAIGTASSGPTGEDKPNGHDKVSAEEDVENGTEPVTTETPSQQEVFDPPSWAFRENEVVETSMVLLNEIYVTPLPILYRPPILSAAILIVSVSILTRQSLAATQRYLYAGQPRHRQALSTTLGLDLERGVNVSKFVQQDVDVLQACLTQFAIYQASGLVDSRVGALIPSAEETGAATAE